MFRLLSLTNYPSPGNKLRLILLAILNCKFDNFLALFGLVCSSFVATKEVIGDTLMTLWAVEESSL